MFIIAINDPFNDEMTIGETPFETLEDAKQNAIDILQDSSPSEELEILIYSFADDMPLNSFYWKIQEE